jgi:hypothetical protein
VGAWDAAVANTALKYDPQQAAIQRQIDANPGNVAANEAAIQGYGTTGRTNIGTNYNTLYGLLDTNRANQNTDLNAGAARTEAGYDQADAAIRTQGQDSRNYLQSIMDRTGQTGALGSLNSSSALENLIGTQIGRNSIARAGSAGNLRDWGAKQDVFAGEGINAAHSGEAMDRSDFEAQLLALLGGNKLEGMTEGNRLSGQFSDLLGSRQNDLMASYEQLAQQEWENAFKQAQLDSQNTNAAADRASSDANAAAGRALTREGMNKDPFDLQAWLQQDKDNAFRDKELAAKYPNAVNGTMDAQGLIQFAHDNNIVDALLRPDIAQTVATLAAAGIALNPGVAQQATSQSRVASPNVVGVGMPDVFPTVNNSKNNTPKPSGWRTQARQGFTTTFFGGAGLAANAMENWS